MLQNLNKPYPFFDDLGFHLKVILGISLGMFLFVLFFQPVAIIDFEFNSKLMVIAGYGGIAFVILSLNQIVVPSIFPKVFLGGRWSLYKEILLQLTTWAMLAVAYNFYSRYVGQVKIDFGTSFRIILLGLFPMVVLVIFNRFKSMRMKLDELEEEALQAGLFKVEKVMDAEVTFDSEYRSDNFTVNLSNIVFIRSANNYIEVMWLSGDSLQKQLIRSTLKRAEEILQPYNNIFRCHRTTLVNADYVIKLTGNPGNLRLIMGHCNEEIPVSRQYLLGVREALERDRDE